MEDVLEVYSRPYDEDYPVICMDEKPVQFFPTFAKDSAPKRMAFNMRITSISATAQQVFSFLQSLWLVGDMPTPRKDGLLRIGQSR